MSAFAALSSVAACLVGAGAVRARARGEKSLQMCTGAPFAVGTQRPQQRGFGFGECRGVGAARRVSRARASESEAAPAIAPAHLRTTITPVPPEVMAEGKGEPLSTHHTGSNHQNPATPCRGCFLFFFCRGRGNDGCMWTKTLFGRGTRSRFFAHPLPQRDTNTYATGVWT